MDGVQKLFTGMRISATGLAAERVRMDTIAENIANARVTQTPGGGPYRRKMVVFEPILRAALDVGKPREAVGVRASRIVEDDRTPFEEIHDPSHPHADANGNVRFPNVNAILEMTDLITSMRAYEANLSAQEYFVQMAERALQVAR